MDPENVESFDVERPLKRRPSSPGAVLEDMMEGAGWTLESLAEDLEVPVYQLQQFLQGSEPITQSLAETLAKHLGGGAELWLALQAN